ncbi:MAG: hypothetical protein V4730_04460 [Pseudomonadota bacterium]
MTLIMGYSDKNSIILGSDILISGTNKKSVAIPTRYSSNQSPLDSSFTHTSSKLEIINNSICFCWSGPEIFAKAIYYELLEITKPITSEKITKAIDDVLLPGTNQPKEMVMLIAYHNSEENFCELLSYGEIQLLTNTESKSEWTYGGTGSYPAYQIIDSRIIWKGASFINEKLLEFASKISAHFFNEVATDLNHHYGYGGFYEIAIFSNQANSFIKIPINYYLFDKSDLKDVSPSIFYSCNPFFESGFMVTRFNHENESIINFQIKGMGELKAIDYHHNYRINSFAVRSPNGSYIILMKEGHGEDPKIAMQDGSINFDFSANLSNEILAL